MVTLVRPRSISFKCRRVIAIPAAIAGKMPAPKEKGNDNGGASNHGSVLPKEKESKLHRAVFGVIASDQFRFRFRQVEGQPVCFREYSDGKDPERYPHRNSQQPTDRIFPVPGKWQYHPAMIDLILHNFR